MKRVLIAVWVLLVLLLSTTTIWFCYIDRKMNKAIDKQNEINSQVYEALQTQEKSMRILETNNEIMLNIIVNGDYYEKD